MAVEKNDGGIVEKWQIHNLDIDPELVKQRYPEIKDGKARVMTGTIVSGHYRFEDGFHMRSGMIVEFDEENGIIESVSTRYKLQGPEGDPVLGCQDVGNAVMRIFY